MSKKPPYNYKSALILFFLICILIFNSSVSSTFEISHDNYVESLPSSNSSYEELNSPSESIKDGPFEFMLPEDPIMEFKAKVTSHGPSTEKLSNTVGTINIAVILVEFKGLKHSTSYTPSYYRNLLFNHNNPKSAASYYSENSYGKLNITGEILGDKWFESIYSKQYWGEDIGLVFPNVDNKRDYIYNLVEESVHLVDPYANFSRYDADGDDQVDHLLVIHAGDAQEQAGGLAEDIWSHRWWIPTGCLVDGVTVKEYTMCAETSPIGTFVHELGHDIGNLPDLYDADYTSDGIGQWGVMGSGAWNYNDTGGSGERPGDTPAQFCAYSKIKLGWVIPKVVTVDTPGLILPAIETTSKESVLKIFISNASRSVTLKEYFLVSYRTQVGFDKFIPGTGILIWHIDECSLEEENNNEYRKLVDLEEADAIIDGWEQLDYYNSFPTGATIPDDEGSSSDPWSPSNNFTYGSFPNSDSNDGVINDIQINITGVDTVSIAVAIDPFPWDYTLNLMDQSSPSYIDDEPAIVEHGARTFGFSREFSVVWHTNRSGNRDICGSQTLDAGVTWKTPVAITTSSANDFSPSMIVASPPAFWTGIYEADRPIASWQIGPDARPPPHFIVAFVSDRTGSPEIFVTLSETFYTWSHPVQLTNNSVADIDPCLVQTSSGIGLFWAAYLNGNFEICFMENIWDSSNIVQITQNSFLDRGPSYCRTRNNTHLLTYEHNSGGNSTVNLLRTNDILSWPTTSIVCTSPTVVSVEPSLLERDDHTLVLTFTRIDPNIEEIHQIISSDWVHWSPHLVMGFLKNASSPNVIEARCGSLFMSYSSYNYSQIHHVYLMHTTQCFRFGIGIKYPDDTGSSFFNPYRVEQNNEWVYSGDMQLNETDFIAASGNINITLYDTQNTETEDDDQDMDSRSFDNSEPFINIDPVVGVGNFNISSFLLPIPADLPLAQIYRLEVKWGYTDLDFEPHSMSASMFFEIIPSDDHIVFYANDPESTTFNSPYVTQYSILKGLIGYGVESVTLMYYDTQETAEVDDDQLYSHETLVFTETAKKSGEWVAKLHNLQDNEITRIVAIVNGIHPRIKHTLFIEKHPEDRIPPVLALINPCEAYATHSSITFSEFIIDPYTIDPYNFNYGVDESSIKFSYKIIDPQSYQNQTGWIDVDYDPANSSWKKLGDVYNFTLTLNPDIRPIIVAFYWTASDLAEIPNVGNDGNPENPHLILFLSESTIIITTYPESSIPTTISTTTSRDTNGFNLGSILITLTLIIIIYGSKRKRS